MINVSDYCDLVRTLLCIGKNPGQNLYITKFFENTFRND